MQELNLLKRRLSPVAQLSVTLMKFVFSENISGLLFILLKYGRRSVGTACSSINQKYRA